MIRSSAMCWIAASGAIALGVAFGADSDPAAAPVGSELPVRRIPNIPEAAEAYYAPDSFHLISYLQDPAARRSARGGPGSLTYTLTDIGTEIRRINDHGDDACSYFFPDMKHVVWTSTRDNPDMPPGDWSNDADYPQGAELYISDLNGRHVRRLTRNKWYEAEATVSTDGKWVFFGRQIDGKADIWKIRADGSGEQRLTFAEDWQPGEPYPLPDGEHLIFRAWKKTVKDVVDELSKKTGRRLQTPMTLFTMKTDGTDVQPRTFTHDMNWSPYPAPDGRHFFYVRIVDRNNWEIFMGDLAGGEPVRLTYNPSFDGFPAISPDGKKLLFARSEGKRPMSGLHLYVMDVSSLHVGPENYRGGIPPKATPPPGWAPDPDLAKFERRAEAQQPRS